MVACGKAEHHGSECMVEQICSPHVGCEAKERGEGVQVPNIPFYAYF
jgi:hypothetical protein